MARGVRFTKPERVSLLHALEECHSVATLKGQSSDKMRAAMESARAKIEDSEKAAPHRETGLAIGKAIEAFTVELGARLVLPPSPPGSWYAIQTRKLASMGVTVDDCRSIAKQAGSQWKGKIKVESLINQGAVLLDDAKHGEAGPDNNFPMNLGDLDDL